MQTHTPGLHFDTAWERKTTMTYQGQSFYVVSLDDLVASKIAAGQPKDLEDVQALQSDEEA